MARQATENWLRTNLLGLLISAAALAGTYTTLNSKVDVVTYEVAQQAEYKGRVQYLEKEMVQVKADQSASRQYWERFEDILQLNTTALNNNTAVMAGVKVQLDTNTRRLDRLETAKGRATR